MHREGPPHHRWRDGRPPLRARSQIRTDGERATPFDRRLGNINRVARQCGVACETEISSVGGNLRGDGDRPQCPRTA